MKSIWHNFSLPEILIVVLMASSAITFGIFLNKVLFGNTQCDSGAWESIEAPKDTDLDCWRQKENHNNIMCYPKHTC